MSRWRKTGIGVGLLTAAAVMFFVWHRDSHKNGRTPPAPLANVATSLATAPPSSNPATSPEPASAVSPSRFTDPDHGFSFTLPEGYTASTEHDQAGDVVLVTGSTPNAGFQIFVTPFDEDGPLTATRVHRDLPKKTITNPRTAHLAGVPALVFSSREADLGNTFEVWFVSSGSLYQLRALAEFEREVEDILNTWQFATRSE